MKCNTVAENALPLLLASAAKNGIFAVVSKAVFYQLN